MCRAVSDQFAYMIASLVEASLNATRGYTR